MKRFTILVLILFLAPLVFGARILVVKYYYTYAATFDTLTWFLEQEGHDVDYQYMDLFDPDYSAEWFPELDNFDEYFLVVYDRSIPEDHLTEIIDFVSGGGRFILEIAPLDYGRENGREILERDEWYEDLGQPRIKNETYVNPIPSDLSAFYHHFILPLDSTFASGFNIDSIGVNTGGSISLADSTGSLKPFLGGGREAYCISDDGGEAVYDSFAIVGMSGNWENGEVYFLVVHAMLVSHAGFVGFHFFYLDNPQFARVLFAANDRAASATLVQEDTRGVCFLTGDFTPFVADSSRWSISHPSWGMTLSYDGCDLRATAYDECITISLVPFYEDFALTDHSDTFNICLTLLPDSTGETILPRGEVCQKMYIDLSAIEENPTAPESMSISAYPNPFNSSIQVNAPSGSKIQIVDLQGNSITTLSENTTWTPSNDIESGVYLVKIQGINEAMRVVYLK